MSAITEARTVAEMHDAFRAAVREAIAEAGGVAWPRPAAARVADEEYRRWHVREVQRRDGGRSRDPSIPKPPSVPRTPLHEQLARPNDDGTIDCAGPCGETKPVKKFPTARGGIGRLSVCRACRDAAIAERKASSVRGLTP